ncbi:hypothetical protein [Balneatrix alpica]|uniref:Uncharacterized protein n=1 Tax=Balneatrix alpica TaxID=75684 RepID=A0ABV5Z8R5_9GAMM|nr:hypothetical protein [Balneatrix alpica]
MFRALAAIWGIIGVSALLLFAIARLTPISLEAWHAPWQWQHWVTFWVFMLFMLYSEGYKGFQKAFSPRTAARAYYLSQAATLWQGLLAPAFCMGYFHTTRKRQIISICITSMVIVLVLLFRLLPQPWRGILDAGVVAGLAWGLVSFWSYCWAAWFSHGFAYSAELPNSAS